VYATVDMVNWYNHRRLHVSTLAGSGRPSRSKADQQPGRRRRGARGRLPAFDLVAYRQRNVVEHAVNKLRDARAVATRYDVRDFVYRGTIDIAGIRIWPRDAGPIDMRDSA
jgi:transposase